VVYFDTPAGTGLSYSIDRADYVTNDTQAASDLHHGLLAWYDIYSPLQSNSLYLSGEKAWKIWRDSPRVLQCGI